MSGDSLAGVGVLVTRPAHQADELAGAIEAAGGSVFRFPVIDIVARAPGQIRAEASALAEPDIIIFVSANAVALGAAYATYPAALIAAIGPATGAAALAAGLQVDLCPGEHADSEHLSAMDALQNVQGKRVWIIRGTSGREYLAETLRERGALVDYLPVYERRATVPDAEQLRALTRSWREGAINCVVVMSVDTLSRLVDVLPDACLAKLRKTPLVTPSARVIQTATEMLPGTPAILATEPACGPLVRALVAAAKLQ
jgi:uroporphyrinogen-III synthase